MRADNTIWTVGQRGRYKTNMARFTLRDAEKTISFIDDDIVSEYLIAACATEPGDIEELLLAVEPHHRGITARVMQGLLLFDVEAAARTDVSRGTRFKTWHPESSTVEVIDQVTDRIATGREDGGVLCVDLERRDITGYGGVAAPLATRGTLRLPSSSGTRQYISFVLGEPWVVDLTFSEQEEREETEDALYA